MIGIFAPLETINDSVRHASGTTGIANGSWTKRVIQNGVTRTDVACDVIEDSGGYYRVSFTPDTEGIWMVDVFVTASPATVYSEKYVVYSLETHIGGDGFDVDKHSLRNIHKTAQLIRYEQVGIKDYGEQGRIRQPRDGEDQRPDRQTPVRRR